MNLCCVVAEIEKRLIGQDLDVWVNVRSNSLMIHATAIISCNLIRLDRKIDTDVYERCNAEQIKLLQYAVDRFVDEFNTKENQGVRNGSKNY